jgi:hypothetical protein
LYKNQNTSSLTSGTKIISTNSIRINWNY